MGKDQATQTTINLTDPLKSTPLTVEELDKIKREYIANETAKFNERIKERATRLEEKLKDKSSRDYKITTLRVHLQMVKDQMRQLKDARKTLRGEIKAIRDAAKEKKKGVVKTPHVAKA